MPLIPSTYRAPFWLKTGHAQTLFPVFFRKVPDLPFQREVIKSYDGDDIDIDWIIRPAAQGVVVFSHGMEGHSRRKYIKGMAKTFLDAGFDILSRNCRGCSGRMNKNKEMYHSGQTDDLRKVVQLCIANGYSRIILVGFSMGGNQTLKFLGEEGSLLCDEVKCAITFSVPCDLASSVQKLSTLQNKVYLNNFLKTLKKKIRAKHKDFPDQYSLEGLTSISNFYEFDSQYTAPIYGFSSAEDYWEKASCLPFLSSINRPTLLVNAINDPFLGVSCYPYAVAKESAYFYLETPEEGGHMGFFAKKHNYYWSDFRALEFVRQTGFNSKP